MSKKTNPAEVVGRNADRYQIEGYGFVADPSKHDGVVIISPNLTANNALKEYLQEALMQKGAPTMVLPLDDRTDPLGQYGAERDGTTVTMRPGFVLLANRSQIPDLEATVKATIEAAALPSPHITGP